VKVMVVILIALGLLTLIPACAGTPKKTGILEGKVSIGPITPVEMVTPVPTPPEVYAARKVLVYNSERNKLLHTVSLDDSGYYRIELAPGIYIVDINHVGIDRSSDVPQTIEIETGNDAVLNISIDTGLR
jgi:hypothetical protein